MANHVTNIIEIQYPSEVSSAIEEIYNKLMENNDLHCLYDNVEMTREWYETNIGAKWARFNDNPSIEEDVLWLSIESAWHEISPFIDRLNELTENKCVIKHQFIDEVPLFGGTRLYEDGEVCKENVMDDMDEMLAQEIRTRLVAENLTFDSDHDREDWLWDWKWDWVYESIEIEDE